MLKKLIEIIIYTSVIFSLISGAFLFMSYDSGWNKLAQYYKTDWVPSKDLLNEQNAIFRRNDKSFKWLWKKSFKIGVFEEALYLSTDFSFFNMPSLLIPWDAINHVRVSNNNFLKEDYELDIGTPTITTLILPKLSLEKAENILATKQ